MGKSSNIRSPSFKFQGTLKGFFGQLKNIGSCFAPRAMEYDVEDNDTNIMANHNIHFDEDPTYVYEPTSGPRCDDYDEHSTQTDEIYTRIAGNRPHADGYLEKMDEPIVRAQDEQDRLDCSVVPNRRSTVWDGEIPIPELGCDLWDSYVSDTNEYSKEIKEPKRKLWSEIRHKYITDDNDQNNDDLFGSVRILNKPLRATQDHAVATDVGATSSGVSSGYHKPCMTRKMIESMVREQGKQDRLNRSVVLEVPRTVWDGKIPIREPGSDFWSGYESDTHEYRKEIKEPKRKSWSENRNKYIREDVEQNYDDVFGSARISNKSLRATQDHEDPATVTKDVGATTSGYYNPCLKTMFFFLLVRLILGSDETNSYWSHLRVKPQA